METLPRRFSVHAGRLHAHLRGLTAIARKRPRRDPPQHILTYIEALTRSYRAPRQAASGRLAYAVRRLIVGQVVAPNPATAVRGPKHTVKKGKTPVLDGDEALRLIDNADTSTIGGLRASRSSARASRASPISTAPAYG